MVKFLYRFCPFAISMVLTQLIYYKIDKNNKITKKIDSHIKVKPGSKDNIYLSLMFLCLIILVVIAALIVDIPDLILYILSGIIAGFFCGLSSKLHPVSKK